MKRNLIFFTFFFLSPSVFSQSTASIPLVLTHITDENGLSDNHVTCVYKDKGDLLWVGTIDGLNLLDGSTIRVFRNNPEDSNSICNNSISGITEDSSGLIWICTGSGLCYYDKAGHRFSRIRYAISDQKDVEGISTIAIDKNGFIWMGTANGLLQYDPKAKVIARHINSSIAFGTDSRYSNRINKVIVATNDLVWLATSDGLWNYSPLTGIFTKIIHKENDSFYQPLCQTVYEDQHKNIWAGFWSTGLRKYEPATGKITDCSLKTNHSQFVSAIIEMLQPDGRSILWLNGKLAAYDETKDELFNYPLPVTEKEFPNVNPAFRSNDGWLWLASDEGLYIFNPGQQIFNHQLFARGITSQEIVFGDYHNNLLLGAAGEDFLKYKDLSGKLIKDFSGLRRKESAALCMSKDGADDLWMGTSEGILHVNLVSGDHKWFYHIDGDSSSLPRDFVEDIFIDSRRNCWVFPWREGVWQMDMQSGKCKKLFDGFINQFGITKKLVISDAREDAEGNIWMADLDEGIILFDHKTKKFSKPFESEIGAMTHTARIFQRGNWMYSSLSSAIIKWDIHNKKLIITKLPSELSKPIDDFYPDKKGDWWLATANGLIVYNEAENSFRKFTTTDGLYQNDLKGTIFCAANGAMFFGNINYISSFDPEQLKNTSSEKKKMVLTEFNANGKQIVFKENSTISLSNKQNNIIIRWALPAYGNPFRNRYYYRLQGIDTTWKYAGNSGEVQFASLSSGHYSIYLKAATANETESENILRVNFVINPPFWKTWWFITLFIVAIGSLFFAVVRYISQRNLKEKLLRLEKEQAIEKERNRISHDMHDDLGSGLTKIAIMSEVVKKQLNEPEKARQQLENISQSSRELVDNLQDIIWVLNPKNDTLENLASYIREYGLKFFEPFGISIHFQYPEKFPEIKLSEETRRNIFLVVKEIFNNIAKHAWCNHVLVSMIPDASSVLLSIKDDGKGFDQEKTRLFGNGLVNMKNRIEQIGGVINVESAPGSGTMTKIEIPV